MTLKELVDIYPEMDDIIIEMLDKYISIDIVAEIKAEIEKNIFTMEEAITAVAGMKNTDGTTGEYWTVEQTTKVLEDYKLPYTPAEFYYILSMMRSDYFEIFGDDITIYIKLADEWLSDPDVPPFKSKRYYHHVVLGE